jgi:hypothetical protein
LDFFKGLIEILLLIEFRLVYLGEENGVDVTNLAFPKVLGVVIGL